MTAESLATLCVWNIEEIIRRADNGAYLLQDLANYVKSQERIDTEYLLAMLDIADDIFLAIGSKALEQRTTLEHLEEAAKCSK